MVCAACQNTTSKDVPVSQSSYEKLQSIYGKANSTWDEAWRILEKNVARIEMLSEETKYTLDITESETLSDLFELVSRLASSLETELKAKSRTRLFLCTPCLKEFCTVGKAERHHFMENGLDLGVLYQISTLGISFQNSATVNSLQHLLWPLSWLPLFLTAWVICFPRAELECIHDKYPRPILYMSSIKRKLLDYSVKYRLRPEVKPVPPLKVGQTLGSSNPVSSTSRRRGQGSVSVKQDTMQDVLSLTSEVTKAVEEWKHGAPVDTIKTDCNTPTEVSLYYKKGGQLYPATAIMINGEVYF